ncbi:MAG: homoserine O-succinyltransferase [Pseudomonadota bacterium]|nr:homoserine O-succinyltransferase [Pseudomonadota bacterium]
MPLVAHNSLPTFDRLANEGHAVLSKKRAQTQDIRELHIGLLNMMPDAALAATENQFIRLVGNCNQIAQFYVYPFTLTELSRGTEANERIKEHYFSFEELQEKGLDALIVSGANVQQPLLTEEPFWKPLTKVMHWALDNVASTLCSCLATHAIVKQLYNIDRIPLEAKKWGVYSHRAVTKNHPILRNINTRFDAPHSRYNEINKAQLESAGLSVLAESEDAGVHIAVSHDQIRAVYLQGHPEYDVNSLLKEYKREVTRFSNNEIEEAPPFPENYFTDTAKEIANLHIAELIEAKNNSETAPAFPENQLNKHIDNTWGDTGKAIFNNWLGLVYGLTSHNRREQFMEGIDPKNPLGMIK